MTPGLQTITLKQNVDLLPNGQTSRYLTELKVIGAGPSRYPRGLASIRDKATNRRARRLPAEYRAKLAAIDATYALDLETLAPVWQGWRHMATSWNW